MQQTLSETPTGPQIPVGVSLPGFKVGNSGYSAFGHSVEKLTQSEWDVRKELRHKVAWVLGTCYGERYSSRGDPAMIYADRIAQVILRDHGYPGK